MSKDAYEQYKEEFYKQREASRCSISPVECYNNGTYDTDYEDDDADCFCD